MLFDCDKAGNILHYVSLDRNISKQLRVAGGMIAVIRRRHLIINFLTRVFSPHCIVCVFMQQLDGMQPQRHRQPWIFLNRCIQHSMVSVLMYAYYF